MTRRAPRPNSLPATRSAQIGSVSQNAGDPATLTTQIGFVSQNAEDPATLATPIGFVLFFLRDLGASAVDLKPRSRHIETSFRNPPKAVRANRRRIAASVSEAESR